MTVTPKDVLLFGEEEEEEEETTSEGSSSENENDQDTDTSGDSSEQADAAGSKTTDDKTVPYERFKEVNDRLKRESESKAEYEQKLKELEGKMQPQDPRLDQVKQTLKDLGYVTRDEVEAELKREREDAELNLELSRLESRYTGKDGLPKFDRQKVIDYALENGIQSPEAAYKLMHQDKIIDHHVKAATGKTGGVKSERSDGSGSSQSGVTDADLKDAAAKGDRGAVHTLIKRMTATKADSN